MEPRTPQKRTWKCVFAAKPLDPFCADWSRCAASRARNFRSGLSSAGFCFAVFFLGEELNQVPRALALGLQVCENEVCLALF